MHPRYMLLPQQSEPTTMILQVATLGQHSQVPVGGRMETLMSGYVTLTLVTMAVSTLMLSVML